MSYRFWHALWTVCFHAGVVCVELREACARQLDRIVARDTRPLADVKPLPVGAAEPGVWPA